MPIKTHRQMAALIAYDPVRGVFTWRVRRRGHRGEIKPGAAAGNVGSGGYRSIRIDGRSYRASRVAWLLMTGRWPRRLIDHRDTHRANDKWANIRLASPSQNLANGRLRKDNMARAKGVRRMGKGWQARLDWRGITHHLGTYKRKQDAIRARAVAADKYHREFRRDH